MLRSSPPRGPNLEDLGASSDGVNHTSDRIVCGSAARQHDFRSRLQRRAGVLDCISLVRVMRAPTLAQADACSHQRRSRSGFGFDFGAAQSRAMPLLRPSARVRRSEHCVRLRAPVFASSARQPSTPVCVSSRDATGYTSPRRSSCSYATDGHWALPSDYSAVREAARARARRRRRVRARLQLAAAE
jgi:hypothetical protein